MPYVTEKNLTDVVRQRWSDIPDARLKQVMQAVVKHLHAFVREIEPTASRMGHGDRFPHPHRPDVRREAAGIHPDRPTFLASACWSTPSIIAARAARRRARSRARSTYPTRRPIANGANMADDAPGIPCFVVGKVRGLDGEPVAGAMLDLWQTDGDGLYEAQRPEIDGAWMRGLYRAQPDGSYLIRTVAPIAYTIPMDGTVGELMNRTNLSHMRPAHIHFALNAPGYHGLVTHLFQSGDKYIETDVVYGVKEPLIVDFKKLPAGSKAPTGEIMNEPFYVVNYDFVLERQAQAAAA